MRWSHCNQVRMMESQGNRGKPSNRSLGCQDRMSLRCMVVCCLIVKMVASVNVDFWFDPQPRKVMVLRAVRGKDARLPCGQGKVFLDGPESYVMWLKGDREVLYRWPNESTDITRFPDPDRVFATTCASGICYDDTYLSLRQVSERDGGFYRCRVHYQASPSVEYQIEVRLVEPSGVPFILDGKGNKITKGYFGPISLGSAFALVCEVLDGHDDLLLYWHRNGEMMEQAESIRAGVLRSEVRVSNATRAELDAHYECFARNSDVTEPLVAWVIIKMYLPPLKVEIRVDNNNNFEVGEPRVVACVVVGCVPPPAITWHLGGTMIQPSNHKEQHDGNFTVSSLALSLSLRDNNQELVCRAHNTHIPDIIFEDKIQIEVGYRPRCTMGRDQIIGAMLGEAESITCMVEASPEPAQFSWTFADNRTVYTAVKKVPNHDNRYASAITWPVSLADLGQVLCRARNKFGEQKKPCLFDIARGGPPTPPRCSGDRAYPQYLAIQCKKGWDGGRPQQIHLELYYSSGYVQKNLTDVAGHFQMSDVDDNANITAVVYASNIRGRSTTTRMSFPTIGLRFRSAAKEKKPWSHYIQIVGLITLALVVITAAFAVCLRARRARQREAEVNNDRIPRADGSFHREPDFARDARAPRETNISLNHFGSYQNQYVPSPVTSCQVLSNCALDNYSNGSRSYCV